MIIYLIQNRYKIKAAFEQKKQEDKERTTSELPLLGLTFSGFFVLSLFRLDIWDSSWLHSGW